MRSPRSDSFLLRFFIVAVIILLTKQVRKIDTDAVFAIRGLSLRNESRQQSRPETLVRVHAECLTLYPG